jgi:hemerythrin-like domain-containing protein
MRQALPVSSNTSGRGQGRAPQLSLQEVAARYRSFLAEKNRFCDHLEVLADLLPDRIDNQDCLHLAQNILPLVMRAHAFEEQVVFPYLESNPDLPESARQSFDRLKYEHFGDESFAQDLCISLKEFVTHRETSNPDTLSWMLRGFFDGVRRHVAFEQALLLPLIEVRSS